MGDTPYSVEDEVLLQEQLVNMTQNRDPGAAFTVHVGDMMKKSLCEEESYSKVMSILSTGPLPTFVLAGDNDFLDCPDPDAGWEFYQQYFAVNPSENQWTVLPEGVPALNVTRWTQQDIRVNPEMFSFVEDGILFMSLTVVNDASKDEFQSDVWYERLADSTYWVSQRVAAATSVNQLRGVVMFGHAEISDPLLPFFSNLQTIFNSNQVFGPVLYIHGDGHVFGIETPFSGTWDSFTAIQVDQRRLG